MNAVVVKTALDPENGSVPAPTDWRIWLPGRPWLLRRYTKNAFRSPLKLLIGLTATNEKTVVCPLGPLYSLNCLPATVTVAIALPVEEMGPAPPRAESQIMISYWAEPVADAPVKMS